MGDFIDLVWKEEPNQSFVIGPIIESQAALCIINISIFGPPLLLHKVVTTVRLSSLIKKTLKPIKRSCLESHWHSAVCRLSKPSGKISSSPWFICSALCHRALSSTLKPFSCLSSGQKQGNQFCAVPWMSLFPCAAHVEFRNENRHVQAPDRSALFTQTCYR